MTQQRRGDPHARVAAAVRPARAAGRGEVRFAVGDLADLDQVRTVGEQIGDVDVLV